MVQRLTLRRRNPYSTRRNRVVSVKTPGGRLVFHYIHKHSKGPHCADCHAPLNGIPHLVRREMSRIPKKDRTVARAYGGNRCHKCLRNKIIRAFLTEEQKIVKRLKKERAPELRRKARMEEKRKAKKLEQQRKQTEKAREKRQKKREEQKKNKRAQRRPPRREGNRPQRNQYIPKKK